MCRTSEERPSPTPLSLVGKLNKQRNIQGCVRRQRWLSTAGTGASQGWLYRALSGQARQCENLHSEKAISQQWPPPLKTATENLPSPAEATLVTILRGTGSFGLWPRSPFPLWILTLAWQPQILHYFKLTKLEVLSEGWLPPAREETFKREAAYIGSSGSWSLN